MQILTSAPPKEVECLRHLMARLTIQYPWAEGDFRTTSQAEEWREWLDGSDSVDAIICDVAQSRAVELMKRARKRHPGVLIIPIAGADVSPAVYVQPEILPFALFWRPLTEENGRDTMMKVLSRLHFTAAPETEKTFTVSTKQRTLRVPLREIFFFEAREKRIFLRQEHQELNFYDTLSNLEKTLSEDFIRCHKSYLVNRKHILTVDWKAQLIQLSDQIAVPISRNYRGRVKECLAHDTSG